MIAWPRRAMSAAAAVAAVRAELSALPGEDLPARLNDLRDRPGSPARTAAAVALAAEALRRSLGVDLYDVQLLAGSALAAAPRGGRGVVAEMATGEGKTFAAALAVAAMALEGRGVHVATGNAYLAERDAAQLRPAYEALGLTCAALPEGPAVDPADKRAAYAADVTYGTGYEFGFDYLRDQTALPRGRRFAERVAAPPADPVQRGLRAAVIDEVDHVLLDDACSPLVLATASGRPAPDAPAHRAARGLALSMAEGEHFRLDRGAAALTAAGRDAAHDALTGPVAETLARPWTEYVEKALHANLVFRRDVHYLVAEGDRGPEVRIVDQSTGRVFEDRTWSDGLHQAVELKEGLPVLEAQRTSARITRQRFYGLYGRCCGLTGTAAGGEREFDAIYGLRVRPVPPHRPCRRRVGPLQAFADGGARWDAVATEAAAVRDAGRPVLVGTCSIDSSLRVSGRLTAAGVAHAVLNGTQDADEAELVSAAGVAGAVTVATNLAGRGTDIALGPGVAEVGGLHVIAAEAQPSARVERQLLGRAARQGRPGSASRYVAADDAALVAAAPWLARQMLGRADAAGRVRGSVEGVFLRARRAADRRAARARIALWRRDRLRDGLVGRIAAER